MLLHATHRIHCEDLPISCLMLAAHLLKSRQLRASMTKNMMLQVARRATRGLPCTAN